MSNAGDGNTRFKLHPGDEELFKLHHENEELRQRILDVEAANTDAVIASRLRELGWVKLPERLSRDQAEPICELACGGHCFGDCDCSDEVRFAWEALRERLMEPTR